MARFNRQKAARAIAFGDYNGDEQAAREFGIASRTIRNWRAVRIPKDPELAAAVEAEKSRLSDALRDWVPAAAETLRKLVQRMGELAAEAEVKDIAALAKAVEVLGDLEIVRKHLAVDDESSLGDDREGEAAEALGRRGERISQPAFAQGSVRH